MDVIIIHAFVLTIKAIIIDPGGGIWYTGNTYEMTCKYNQGFVSKLKIL